MRGDVEECIDFIIICRGIPFADAQEIMFHAAFVPALDRPDLELFIEQV
jgi:hypothetical protein